MRIEQKQVAPRLSHHEEKALIEEEQNLQDIKDGVELKQGVKYEAQDLNALEKRLNEIRKLRETRGVDPNVSPEQREYLEKREKMLLEHLQKFNPTFKEHQYTRPSDGPKYSRLVQQELKNMMDPEYQRMVRDWKDCRRQLFPEDPNASDTRHLYPE